MANPAPTDPIERLARLLAALEGTRRVPDDLARWLSRALIEYRRTGGAVALDVLLGLRGPGQARIGTLQRLRARDLWLSTAWLECEGGSDWARARVLSAAVQRFERRVWPRVRSLDAPPARLTPIDTCLFHAFHQGLTVPASQVHLHRLFGFPDSARRDSLSA